MADYILNVVVNGAEQSVSTIGELENALKATNDELQKTEANSGAFSQLQSQAKTLEAELNVVAKDASTFNNQLKTLNTTADVLGNTFQDTANQAQQLGQSANLQNLNQGINQASNSTQSLRAELRQITQELQQLEPGSARFQELALRAGQLRDTIADTNVVTQSLAGNATERLGTALTGVVNVGVTGLQGVVGGMKLFGVESEKSREILEKLQGLLFVTQAIQGFGALPDSIAAIRAGLSSLTAARSADLVVQEASVAANTADTVTTGINTAAQQTNTGATLTHTGAVVADAAATEGATVATEGFTAALAANPIGLVVVGLTALVGALILFSGQEKVAKTNIDETTNSMLEQSNMMKSQQDAFIELYKTRKELEILQEKDATKRATMQSALDQEIVDLQQDALERQVDSQLDVYAKLLDEFDKYKSAYIGERQVLVREVAQYDEFGIFIGMEQQYETERFKIGESVLNNLRNRLATERAAISADVAAKRLSQEEGRIKEEQATTRFYIDYLTKQKEFLKQSSKAYDDNYAENLTELLSSFSKVRSALETALAEQVKLQQEAKRKELEEQKKADEEAARKRQAALEKARSDYKKSYDDIVKTVKDANAELNKIETTNVQNLEKLRLDQTKTTIDNLDYELKLEQEKVNEVAKLAQDQLKTSVLYNKKKKQFTAEGAKAELEINTNLNKALEDLNALYAEKKRLAVEEETLLEQQRADKIIEINRILNEEISFGDQSVADQKNQLLGESGLLQQKLNLETIDANAQVNNLNLEQYIAYLRERALAQQAVNDQQRLIDEKVAEDEARKSLTNFADLLMKEGLLSDKFSQDELNKITALTAEEASLQIKGIEDVAKANNRELTKDEQARKALLQAQVNQQEELIQKKTEIDTKYRNEKSINDKKLEDDVLAYRIQKLEQYNKVFAELSTAVLGIFDALFEGFKISEENRLNALRDSNDQAINQVTENYNKQLASLEENYAKGLMTQEQYTEASKALEANRTNSIDKLNKNLKKEELKSQKEAFEKEKKLKIASAIIAGIQGAIQAFTGAFQLGPIAGPIVGGILAALVAATTAVQINNIRKTQFDSGGTTEMISANTPSSSGAATSVASSNLPTGGFTAFNEGAMGGAGTGGAGFSPIGSSAQRVYVLESDITATQNRVRVLESNSTFG